MNNQDTPVISFVAKSGAGKTTLLEKLIKRLKEHGIRLAVIKHDAHQFDMDKPGKDTWRLTQAGADITAISSPAKVAVIEKVSDEKQLDEIIGMIPLLSWCLPKGLNRGTSRKLRYSGRQLIKSCCVMPVNYWLSPVMLSGRLVFPATILMILPASPARFYGICKTFQLLPLLAIGVCRFKSRLPAALLIPSAPRSATAHLSGCCLGRGLLCDTKAIFTAPI